MLVHKAFDLRNVKQAIYCMLNCTFLESLLIVERGKKEAESY